MTKIEIESGWDALAWLLGILLGVLIAVVCVFYAGIVQGVTLMLLWRWFAVPIFGLPALTIAQALGLSLILGYVQYKPQRETRSMREILWRNTLGALLYIALGYVLKVYFL